MKLQTEMNFPKLMIGTVQFGMDYGIANTAGKPSYETARDVVKAAYEGGVNCLDTAPGYGDSEKVIGYILKELRLTDKMQVVSKIPGIGIQNLSGTDPEKFITETVEKSLGRLGVKRLAACLFHIEDDIKYIGILRNLEEKGLICGAGISLDTNIYCEKVIDEGIKFVQLPYNILDRRFDDFFPRAKSNGISIFSRSVYLQGLLLMPEGKIMPSLQTVIPVRRKLEKLASDTGMDMSELCMRFVLCNPSVSSVLTGVDNIDQLTQNLRLFGKGPLSAKLYDEIKAAVPPLAEKIIRPSLWEKNA